MGRRVMYTPKRYSPLLQLARKEGWMYIYARKTNGRDKKIVLAPFAGRRNINHSPLVLSLSRFSSLSGHGAFNLTSLVERSFSTPRCNDLAHLALFSVGRASNQRRTRKAFDCVMEAKRTTTRHSRCDPLRFPGPMTDSCPRFSPALASLSVYREKTKARYIYSRAGITQLALAIRTTVS